jgi:hypothetical protein
MASLVMTGDLALQQMTQDLMGMGKLGKKIFRKGLRAGAQVIARKVKQTFPRKTGKAAKSAKVKAIKRSRKKIGVRVALYAASTSGKGGFPYPMGLEAGTKNQPKGRVRKARKRISKNGKTTLVTDEENSQAYHRLSWHVRPMRNVQKAFAAAQAAAEAAILKTWRDELEKASVRR